MEFPIELGHGTTTAEMYKSNFEVARPAALILAHGAGAGRRHPFMVAFARALSVHGIDVVTFNFLYMEQRRRVPDRMPQLVECYEAVIAAALHRLPSARERLFIGGKSMGGRAATHVAGARSVLTPLSGVSARGGPAISGLVLLGYPLHPPGRPDRLRDAHLPDVKRPMLIVQGTRDTFGTPAELAPVLERLTPRPELHVVEGGDHSFKVSGKDASRKQPAVYAEIQAAIARWIGATGARGA